MINYVFWSVYMLCWDNLKRTIVSMTHMYCYSFSILTILTAASTALLPYSTRCERQACSCQDQISPGLLVLKIQEPDQRSFLRHAGSRVHRVLLLPCLLYTSPSPRD